MSMNTPELPATIAIYFWGDNLSDLDTQKHKTYIIQTLLEKGDRRALAWLFAIYGKSTIKTVLSKCRLSKKSAHFWQTYLS